MTGAQPETATANDNAEWQSTESDWFQDGSTDGEADSTEFGWFENFAELFRKLFGGGRAEIVLEEDVDMLVDIVMYLAGGDTTYFPLTWDVCLDFMKQLGAPVKVVPIASPLG